MLADASFKRVRGTSYNSDHVAAYEEVPTDPVVVENVFVKAPVDREVVECDESTASLSKIIDIKLVEEETFDEEITGYRLLDMSILNNIFNYLPCPECLESGAFNLQDFNAKKKARARYLILKCTICLSSCRFYSSETVESESKGKVVIKQFDVNIRAVCGMRALGGGHSAVEKLCGYLNMLKPQTHNNYDKLSNKIKNATKHVAEERRGSCC